MGDFLWTFGVEEALKKVVKIAADQIGLAWGFEDDLLKLQKWLLKGEAFLHDINSRYLHHRSVRIWVEDLHDLVYQVDDVLDQIVYVQLRLKVQTSNMNKVRNFVSPSNNAFIFRCNMAKKMKTLTELLEKHFSEAGPLGLVANETVGPEIDIIGQFRETTSEFDDYQIVGRDVELENIVKQVVHASNQPVLSILPIVGMGGLGKTTLAKLVFNHEIVKQHFDKIVWVCVSEPFIVNKILGAILQNLKGLSNGGDNKEVLLHELQKEMHGQRYFLVLDDVWNENAFLWDELKSCLLRITGKSENFIVVTTRSADVANIMETLPSHHLSKLSDDQCWSLFKESANACGLSMTSNLEILRKELVKKIGGIPLVARVLGRAVNFDGNGDRWEKMLETVLRCPLQEENFVLSILKLSVDRLPSSSLKQCFVYCSNFPKDIVFGKQELIQMWMAQGFLQPQGKRNNTTMENVGDVYFSILLSRCLFQDAFKDKLGRTICCKMHDLIHDIACAISSEQNLKLHPSNMVGTDLQKKGSKKVASKLRTRIDFIKEISQNIDKSVFDVKIKNFACLRVLKISLLFTGKLPDSIGQLIHLRYLEISSYSRLKFPKSIVMLYNLQTLNLRNSMILYLPENLAEFVSLRHLEFSPWVKTPPCLSRLTELQTLSSFVVGLQKSCKITELGPLKNLQGSLSLLCLEKVESKEEARKACLVDKENLDVLKFEWSTSRKQKSYNDLEVLEELQPHKNLKSLEIKNFASNHLPSKIFVEELRVIILWHCENCERLPMLGELNNLKELEIDGFHGVLSIDNEFYGNDSNQKTFFPKLERFELRGMINLEQWEEITRDDASSNVTTFPYLKELLITGCPKLLNIPDVFGYGDENDVQHLENLIISECNKLTKLPNGLNFCHSNQLVKIDKGSNLSITLGNKPKLFSLTIGPLDKLPQDLGHLMNLRKLKIVGCMENYDFSLLQHLPSLKRLGLVEDYGSVTQLPQQLQHLTGLEFLWVDHFGGIEALPEWLENFVSLDTLRLSFCQNLKQLPSTKTMLCLTKLRQLYTYRCPQLLLGEGDTERAKLSHLPKIEVYINGLMNPLKI